MNPSVPPGPPLSPPLEPGTAEPPLRRRSLAASALFHAAVLGLLLGLWRSAPPEELPIPVIVVREGPGAAGTMGGAAGGGNAPATTAQAAPATEAQPAQETSDAPPLPQATEPAPPPPRHKPHMAARPRSAAPPTPAPQPAQVAAAPEPQPAPGRPGAGGPALGLGAGQGTKGAGDGAVGDGPAGSPGDDYLERVRRWIRRFQHYPEEATQRKEEGTALLKITLARDGTVLKVAIERSSGYPLLDQAAVKSVVDASPVPPFPATYRPDKGTMVLPAHYTLGFFERLF